jgi:hypothetical protein
MAFEDALLRLDAAPVTVIGDQSHGRMASMMVVLERDEVPKQMILPHPDAVALEPFVKKRPAHDLPMHRRV